MKRSLVHSNKLTNQSTRTQQAAPVFEALALIGPKNNLKLTKGSRYGE